jgi:hypothetical protein
MKAALIVTVAALALAIAPFAASDGGTETALAERYAPGVRLVEHTVGPVGAYRLAFDSLRQLFTALPIAVLVVSLLASTVFLLPIAIWRAERWALIVPALELEDVSAFGALRPSGRLVRRRWLKVASLIVAGAGSCSCSDRSSARSSSSARALLSGS